MEFLEKLKGEANRFDKGFALNSGDTKALRDAIVYLLDKVAALEARLSGPADPILETEAKPKKAKKA